MPKEKEAFQESLDRLLQSKDISPAKRKDLLIKFDAGEIDSRSVPAMASEVITPIDGSDYVDMIKRLNSVGVLL